MAWLIRLLALCGGALALSACVTTDPYAAAYDGCDRQAGACYADCRVLGDEDRRAACQQRCTTSVNRCFAQVTAEAERRASFRAARDPFFSGGAVFYGRYGLYDPYLGYRYGRHGRRYSYGGYAYDRFGYDRWGYDRYGYDRYGYDYHGRRRFGSVPGLGGVQPRRPGRPTVTRDDPRDGAPDDGRYTGEDGSVYTEDGRRLRYGGEPQRPLRPRSGGVRPTGRTLDPTVRPAAPSGPIGKPAVRPRTPKADPVVRPTRPAAAPKARPRTAPRARPRPASPRRSEPKRIEP